MMDSTSSRPPQTPREHERKTAYLPVEWRIPGGRVEAATKNISQSGMFIETKAPLPAGTKTFFRIRLGQNPLQFHIEGEVIWSQKRRRRKNQEPKPSGMGIRFLSSRVQSSSALDSIFSLIDKSFDPATN